jgi:hypothetical protein
LDNPSNADTATADKVLLWAIFPFLDFDNGVLLVNTTGCTNGLLDVGLMVFVWVVRLTLFVLTLFGLGWVGLDGCARMYAMVSTTVLYLMEAGLFCLV